MPPLLVCKEFTADVASNDIPLSSFAINGVDSDAMAAAVDERAEKEGVVVTDSSIQVKARKLLCQH